ncbi:hypothetical protein WJX81_000763 [Elliptochloris bilobata]|uniref:Protein kinase domain-containing protein n=1 Tax=Elliptochloris bilobata TaxID=381761 RepID=A0AAW1S9I6_9CHLO
MVDVHKQQASAWKLASLRFPLLLCLIFAGGHLHGAAAQQRAVATAPAPAVAAPLPATAAPLPAAASSPAGDVLAVRGSGSTAVLSLMNMVLASFNKAEPQAAVTYDAVGSMQGIQSLTVHAYDFAVSDVPLNPSQYLAISRPFLQIPFAVSGVAVTTSLPGATDGSLKLNADTLAKIYMCMVTRWDDPAIVALNPHTSLPAHAILPVGRIEGSGTTSLFSSYLTFSGAWNLGNRTLVAFPSCVNRVKGTPGMITAVQSTPFAIGYAEVGTAHAAKLPLVGIANVAGNFSLPDAAHFKTAVPRDVAVPDVTGSGWYSLAVGASDNPGAYPIIGLEYFLMDQNLAMMGPGAGSLLRRLALYLFSPAVTSVLQGYGFDQLPPQLMGVRDMVVSALANSGVPQEAAGDGGAGGFKWWYGLLAGLGGAALLAALAAGALLWRRRRRHKELEAQKSADAERARVAASEHSSGDKFSLHPFGTGNTLGSSSSRGTPFNEDGKIRRGTERSPSGELGSAKLSLYAAIPEILRSRSACHELDGLECGPLIGRGSYGKVYKGRWRGGTVAIKIIAHDGSVASQMSALRESLLCKNITHPNVVQTYKVHTVHGDTGSDAGGSGSPNSPVDGKSPVGASGDSAGLAPSVAQSGEPELLETWIVMAFCDQGTLEQAVRQGRFTGNLTAIYLCLLDIAAGMDYLHSLGILHSDLKAANVLLRTVTPSAFDPRGCVCKLADMGCARIVEQGRTHVSTTTYGTVAYMPPEMLQQGKVTKSVDVYSFAMIMIELYTGERLFKGMEAHQLMYLVFSGRRPACDLNAMPPGYSALLQDCWATNPAQRPSFSEMIPRIRDMIKEERAARLLLFLNRGPGLMSAVVASFNKAEPQAAVTYDPVGSLQGIQGFTAQVFDFAVSNVPLTPRQYSAVSRPFLQFPFAVSGIAVTTALPGAKDGSLRLNADTLAKIYMCMVTRWDDPMIAALNPHTSLPAHAIQPVGRIDGSGATSLFSDYLAFSRFWTLGNRTQFAFPSCVMRVQGTPGVITAVQGTPFTIGYSEVGPVRSAGLPVAAIANVAGNFTLPDPAHFSTAIPRDAPVPDVTSAAWYDLDIDDSENASAYPIIGLEYFLMNQDLSAMGAGAGSLLQRLALYLFSPAAIGMLQSYGFDQLPPQMMGVRDKVDAALASSGVPMEAAGGGAGGFRWWYGLLAGLAALALLVAVAAGALLCALRRRRQRLEAHKLVDAEEARVAMSEHSSDDTFAAIGTPSIEEAKRRRGAERSASGDTGSAKLSLYTAIPEILRSRSACIELDGLECGPLIGRGSYGRVYKGRWRGGTVAIKVIAHDGSVASQMSALRESLLCKNITHPNVVQTYKVHTVHADAGSEGCRSPMSPVNGANAPAGSSSDAVSRSASGGALSPSGQHSKVSELLETWIVLAFCDQGTLEQAVRQGRFTGTLAAIYLCLLDIAAGMDYLHSLGILHSDLKAANVLLMTVTPSAFDPRGCVCKVADMGCARIVEQGRTHVSTTTYGTVAYMPPEMLQHGKLNKAVDVYSFAMIMVELYTGERLFKGMEAHQVMYTVFSGRRPACNLDAMPPAFAALLQQCWATDPAARPSFSEIIPRVHMEAWSCTASSACFTGV